MRSKRYKEKVDVTLRMPTALNRRAHRIIKSLRGGLLYVPGTDEPVKPSISVLALRGLKAELNRIEAAQKKQKEARAECQQRGVKSSSCGGALTDYLKGEGE